MRPRPDELLPDVYGARDTGYGILVGYDDQLLGTQHVVEYQEAARSHQALPCDHGGAIGAWTPSELTAGQALRQPALLSGNWTSVW